VSLKRIITDFNGSSGAVQIEQTVRDHYIETGTKIAALYSDMYVYKKSQE
jgi:hypothetical protein